MRKWSMLRRWACGSEGVAVVAVVAVGVVEVVVFDGALSGRRGKMQMAASQRQVGQRFLVALSYIRGCY
ncbi:hypothetical protein D8674_006122 [Pyrus ussuriensis x Pyrus communis]|uniref:Uncharacterized protein n=1 Tax=Pyrus ussuriensis x Pyrus communis TaxID=2448454 RepID=A0A5N5FTF5_9ROSA|nr:hypothetical protein D8674_006122 [Pyrus ussuriensis x Pyrus communis]